MTTGQAENRVPDQRMPGFAAMKGVIRTATSPWQTLASSGGLVLPLVLGLTTIGWSSSCSLLCLTA